ncbi:MAG: hypothetical protein ABI963_03465 [Rhizomicrobium sp.]
MKRHMIVLAAALAFTAMRGARAENVTPPSPDQSAHVAEFLDIYDKGCLQAYQHNDLTGFAAGLQCQRLTLRELARHSVTDKEPGKGWEIKGKSGTYILMTDGEDPLCTVVTAGPANMPALEPYRALVASHAAQWNLALTVWYRGSLAIVSRLPGYLEMQRGSPSFVTYSYISVQPSDGRNEFQLTYSPPPIEQISP